MVQSLRITIIIKVCLLIFFASWIQMRKKFIVVDRDQGFLEGIKLNLEEIADVVVCSNINDMFIKLSSDRYDILLLDSVLLGKSGANILHEIKLNQPQIIIVGMQLYGEEPDVRKEDSDKLVNMHVYKPVDFEIFLNRLSTLSEGLYDKSSKH